METLESGNTLHVSTNSLRSISYSINGDLHPFSTIEKIRRIPAGIGIRELA